MDPSTNQNFIASPNPIEEDSFMAKTTDIILSELESLDSTKMLTTQLQNQPINVENILTSNSSFSPPSSKESSEIGNFTNKKHDLIFPKTMYLTKYETSFQS